jgi:hypothetical protein
LKKFLYCELLESSDGGVTLSRGKHPSPQEIINHRQAITQFIKMKSKKYSSNL